MEKVKGEKCNKRERKERKKKEKKMYLISINRKS